MKVILLEKVSNLGKKFDIKDVSEGYARNFLFAKKLAKPANDETIKWADAEKKKKAYQQEEQLEHMQKIASKIDGFEVEIPVKIGKENQLFESVSASKIAAELKKADFEIDKNQVKLEKPIKELGEFPVKIGFEFGLEAEIKVIVIPEN